MTHIVVAVRDTKAEVFNLPFCTKSVGIAVRSFDDEVNREHEDNLLNRHPADFHLYQLGEFDDNTGEFKTHIPKLLMQGDQVKRPLAISEKLGKVSRV